jgi:hypothetical protein
LCEGEKDADRLQSLQLCATTLSGGTNWTPEITEHFRSRDVIILPDFDDAGAKKALDAAHALQDVAASIRIVVLPGLTGEERSKDVSDWLDADPARDKTLVEVCLAAPLWTLEAEVEGLEAAAAVRTKRKTSSRSGIPHDDDPPWLDHCIKGETARLFPSSRTRQRCAATRPCAMPSFDEAAPLLLYKITQTRTLKSGRWTTMTC